jgi:hypothetical protein
LITLVWPLDGVVQVRQYLMTSDCD